MIDSFRLCSCTLSTYFSHFYFYRIPVTVIRSPLNFDCLWSVRDKVLYAANTIGEVSQCDRRHRSYGIRSEKLRLYHVSRVAANTTRVRVHSRETGLEPLSHRMHLNSYLIAIGL